MGFQLDLRVSGYTLLISLLTGLLFGMAPTWHFLRLHLNESLKRDGLEHFHESGETQFPENPSGMEITLSMALLIGAGLLLRSLWHILEVDPGFRSERVVYIMIRPSMLRYANNEQKAAFYTRLQSRLESSPVWKGPA